MYSYNITKSQEDHRIFTYKYFHRLIHWNGMWAKCSPWPGNHWYPLTEQQIVRWLQAEGYDVDAVIHECRRDPKISDIPVRFYNLVAPKFGFPVVNHPADMRPLPIARVGIRP